MCKNVTLNFDRRFNIIAPFMVLRARSLYFTVDDSSDLLEIGLTRKIIEKSAFILFFPLTCHKTVHHSYIFRYKT